MTGAEYRRWALDSLRERAAGRGIEVTGRKDRPRLFLSRCDGLLVCYQENWWRSAFGRSGYGGSFEFESEASDPQREPAFVLLVNLPEFFVPMRSPETLAQIDYFIERLLRLSDWCVDEKSDELRALASETGTALSKAARAGKLLREFLQSPDAQS